MNVKRRPQRIIVLLVCLVGLVACQRAGETATSVSTRVSTDNDSKAPMPDTAVRTVKLGHIDFSVASNVTASEILSKKGDSAFCDYYRAFGQVVKAADKNALGVCYFLRNRGEDEYVAGEKLIWEAADAGDKNAISNRNNLLAAYNAANIKSIADTINGAAAGDARSVGTVSWYAADLNNFACNPTTSPAEKIRSLQDAGFVAKTEDFGNPASPPKVKVSYEHGDFITTFTYYRSKAFCEAELPKSKPVPSKYE